MIPEFPKFKKLELSDKTEIENFTSQFLPYSDFNFVSMWSWDIKGEMRLSWLYGNLVVRFTDYLTEELFYSFLGNKNVNETVENLLNLSIKEGLKPKLRLVPEDSIKNINVQSLEIAEDRDHFDYILSTKVLKDFNSTNSLVQRKKRAVNSLRKSYSPTVRSLDSSDINHQKEIIRFIKESLPDDKVIEREFLAISRFMGSHKDPNCLIMGAFINSKLVGFCFAEILKNKFANFHFWKADTKTFKPLYSFLLQEKARLLISKYNIEFLNIEQDLGIQNLRKWKESFGSQLFLKKYTIALKK